MFNFSDFCKEKECPNYVEREHSAGVWRYCELVGTAFYVTERPDNCPHKEEIDARAKYEKEKSETWNKISKTEPARMRRAIHSEMFRRKRR